MTDEKTKIDEEPIVGFIREDEDENESDTQASDTATAPTIVEADASEVVEGEPEQERTFVDADELAELLEQLEAAQAQADEYLDDLRRERAAFQNYKKRQENERAELRQTAIASLLIQILPILDDFGRALEAIPADQLDQPWIEGMTLIQRKLQTTLDGYGIVPIEVEPGQPFDPFIHEAVTYEEQENHKEGEIIATVQQGYRLGERVLRPAMVRVAK